MLTTEMLKAERQKSHITGQGSEVTGHRSQGPYRAQGQREVIDNCSQLMEMDSPVTTKPAFARHRPDYSVVKEN
jgi:hypothetical protein